MAEYTHDELQEAIHALSSGGGWIVPREKLLAMLRDFKERLIDPVEAAGERLRAQLAEQFKGMLETYGKQSEALEAIARALGGEMDAGGFVDQTGRKVFTIRELPGAVEGALRNVTVNDLIGEQHAIAVELGELVPDVPEMDGTDGAHPAWWRGHDDGAKGVARALYLVAAHGRCHEARFSDHAVERAAAEIEQLRLDAETWNRYALTYRTRWQEAIAEVAQALEEAAEARADADRVRRVVSVELTAAVKEAERLRAELEKRGKVTQ